MSKLLNLLKVSKLLKYADEIELLLEIAGAIARARKGEDISLVVPYRHDGEPREVIVATRRAL